MNEKTTISEVYDYSFSVWPSETWGFPRDMFDLFGCLNARVEMAMTPERFESFRSTMSHQGFTIREIERIPHHDPEPVF